VINRSFVVGLVVGVAGVWAFHRWVRPMASNKSTSGTGS